MATTWKSRIVGSGEEDPLQLVANPRNWRIHPKGQQDALGSVLDEVGWVQQILVNKTTGNVVDGHLRVELAISREEPEVPVLYVELTEAEEGLILASLDPLGAMASTDETKLRELLAEVAIDQDDLREVLEAASGDFSIETIMAPELDTEAPGFEQMTFVLSHRQAETVRVAMTAATEAGAFDESENRNGNGNALARVAEAYAG